MPYYPPASGGSGGQSWKVDQIPVEVPNGVRTLFTLPNADTYIAGSVTVNLNGQLLTHAGDYTETTVTSITFVAIPLTGDIIRLNYRTS